MKSSSHLPFLESLTVASFAEAWIEIYSTTLNGFCSSNVASFAEAWIEIAKQPKIYIGIMSVASFAEAWIEICVRQVHTANAQRSPPSRRRGLKSDTVYNVCSNRNRRLLRGGVD